jgi:cytochrome c oxidase assembly protein subunit 15
LHSYFFSQPVQHNTIIKHMTTEHSRIKLLQSLALACALLVIVIVGLSAFIRLSGAGLSCSPWPQCYGHVSRAEQHGLLQTTGNKAVVTGVIGAVDALEAVEAVEAIDAVEAVEAQSAETISAARLAHRILAVVLLPVILLLVMSAFSAKPQAWKERWSAVIALTLVLFLAVLGRWTAGVKIPAVVLGNLLAGFVLFALCWRMTGIGRASFARQPLSRIARLSVLVAILSILAQIVLGGLVSGGLAGMSCPSLSECSVKLPIQWEFLNPFRAPRLDSTAFPMNTDGVLAHALHRWAALMSAVAILTTAGILWRQQRRQNALILIILVALQCALGLILVQSGLALGIAVLHNLFAALCLAYLFSLE